MWGGIVGLIIQLISGGVGGNIAGAALKQYDLGTIGNTFTAGGVVPTVVETSHVRDNIVRIGLNYRFGGPVVARY